jgi:hypothetical protein
MEGVLCSYSLFVGAQVIWLTPNLDSSAASGGVFVASELIWSLGLITSISLLLAVAGSEALVFSVSHRASMIISWVTHGRCSMKCT